MAKSFERVAEDLRTSARGEIRSQRAYWKGDADMIEMFEDDHAQALMVADLIEAGKIPKAMDALMYQDTAARETCGVMIWKKSKGFYKEYMIPEGWCI